jgi:hypothetical protein
MRIGRSILTVIEQRLAGKTAPRFSFESSPSRVTAGADHGQLLG